MIGRVLRRRQEPGSIFEHVDAHVRPDVIGLAEGGAVLPDEHLVADDGVHFAPGARDGIFSGPDDSEYGRAAVERVYDALAALAAKPTAATRRRLREVFREGNVRQRIDPLRERLGSSPPAGAERLYPELRELFLRSGHRDEVKYALSLMSGFRQPADADLFRVIGRHEEFTLYAAVALALVSDDPLGEWLALLPHVRRFGRNELAGLILREPRSREVREQLVSQGLGAGNGLVLAAGCRLDELMARPWVDARVLAGAREILDSLIWNLDSAYDLTDYPDAGVAVEHFLARLSERSLAPGEARTVAELRRFLFRAGACPAELPGDVRLAACGLDHERLARVYAACEALLA